MPEIEAQQLTRSNDGDHVTIGTTTDAAWVSGSGSVVALLKKIATTGGGGGGSGGGAVTATDGALVTMGTTTDTVWGGSGAGTLVAILKKIAGASGGGGGGVVTAVDGGLATLGTTTDAAWSGTGAASEIALQKALSLVLGTVTDAAWSGTGNASLDALLKAIYALLTTGNTTTGTLAKESGGHLAAIDTSTATAATNTGTTATSVATVATNTAALAKEAGGNLATVVTNTTGLAKESGGHLATIDTSTATIAANTTANAASTATTATNTGNTATSAASIATNTAGLAKETGGNLASLVALLSGTGKLRIEDGLTGALATIAAFHNADNQNPGGTANGVLTGGVAQFVNAIGYLDRQRETYSDNIPATGIATGTAQLASPITSITLAQSVTASGTAQAVTLSAVSGVNRGASWKVQVGSILIVDVGAAQEPIYVTAVSGSNVTAIFTKSHASGVALVTFTYNQARDASTPDGANGAGFAAGATYLLNGTLNGGVGGWEGERSAAGELDGASGAGTAVAAEYEYNSGGPGTSGMAYDRARNLQGKGKGSGTFSSLTAAGATSLVLNAAPTGLQAGAPILLDRGLGTEEVVYAASTSAVSGSTITLATGTPTLQAHAATSIIEWDIYAAHGPGLNGFTAAGMGIEEEALYNPVDNQYYIERSATQDGMAAANIPAESAALWNGTTMDRWKGGNGSGNVNLTGTTNLVSGSPDLGTTIKPIKTASDGTTITNSNLQTSNNLIGAAMKYTEYVSRGLVGVPKFLQGNLTIPSSGTSAAMSFTDQAGTTYTTVTTGKTLYIAMIDATVELTSANLPQEIEFILNNGAQTIYSYIVTPYSTPRLPPIFLTIPGAATLTVKATSTQSFTVTGKMYVTLSGWEE